MQGVLTPRAVPSPKPWRLESLEADAGSARPSIGCVWEGRCEQFSSPADGAGRSHGNKKEQKGHQLLGKERGYLQLMGLPLEKVLSPGTSTDCLGKARCGLHPLPGQPLCSFPQDLDLASQEIQLLPTIPFILVNPF